MDLLDAPPQQHAPPAHQVRLDALRKAAQRIDPVRLHYLDVLSQRIATAPEAVQHVLENTLDTALSSAVSRATGIRSSHGSESTHCRYGTTGSTRSHCRAAVSLMRLPPQLEQTPRCLHENATRRS